MFCTGHQDFAGMKKRVLNLENEASSNFYVMKNTILATVYCAFVVAWFGSNAFGADFTHPGISHIAAELKFVKAKLKAKQQPWQQAWDKLRGSPFAELSWKPKPVAHVERGAYNRPDIGASAFMDDGRSAYTHALLWVLTDNETHAKKAAGILNAWSATLKSVSNHDAKLLVGMGGLQYCNAAEILKHGWQGWPQKDQQAFRQMLQNVLYPVIQDFHPRANGNWDASMIQTMMAMGIFLDDRTMFQKAVDYFLKGKGNGAVNHYFHLSGQCQESGRDQAHTQMGLEYLVNAAEIAWKQGVDLYSAYDKRLAKGFEYTAQYNLGNDVPFEYSESYQGKYKHTKISGKSRGRLRPMYEKAYNHYHNRIGMGMPWSQKALQKTRPETGGTMPWSTLMYADQPAGLVKLAAVKATTAVANSTDKDLGLHSDGRIWKFYSARDRNKQLPEVLLIGDSIMNGYREQVIRGLKGKANVDCWLTPMHLNSRNLHQDLKKVASHRNYAVIHFNIGLHGWQEGRIPKGKYQELLKAYVAILKEQAPNARLIWASTTQVHKKGKQELDETINPIIVRRNKIADAVMKKAGVTINDLYGLMSDKLKLVRGDQWHWRKEAYGIMAQQILETI